MHFWRRSTKSRRDKIRNIVIREEMKVKMNIVGNIEEKRLCRYRMEERVYQQQWRHGNQKEEEEEEGKQAQWRKHAAERITRSDAVGRVKFSRKKLFSYVLHQVLYILFLYVYWTFWRISVNQTQNLIVVIAWNIDSITRVIYCSARSRRS